jgi:hypothetical protein
VLVTVELYNCKCVSWCGYTNVGQYAATYLFSETQSSQEERHTQDEQKVGENGTDEGGLHDSDFIFCQGNAISLLATGSDTMKATRCRAAGDLQQGQVGCWKAEQTAHARCTHDAPRQCVHTCAQQVHTTTLSHGLVRTITQG